MKRKKIILIDGNAIIHRSYHAIPPLTTKKGELVNAVYGFTSTLLAVIEKFDPEYIVASFDLKAPTFRHKKFAEYKATRKKAPDDLYQQIDRVKDMVKTFNIPIFEKEGFEADDIIGTMSKIVFDPSDDMDVIIVTGDLDALQLVNDDVSVYTMSRGISKAVIYDEKAVFDRYGLSPEQLKDYKGLRGDASDNIPGVKGIGEKGAITLLQEYNTLEGVYENIENLKGAMKKKLEDGKASAFLSKDLGTIHTEVEIDFDLEACATHEFDRKKVAELFHELSFNSLLKRLPGGDTDLSKKEEMAKMDEISCDVISSDGIDEFVVDLEKQEEVSVDWKSVDGKIQSMFFFWGKEKGYFLELNDDAVLKLKSFFENEANRKVSFDFKTLLKDLENSFGISLKGELWDTKLASYLLNSGRKIELEKVILEELGEEVEKQNGGQLSLGMESEGELAIKGCRRAMFFLRLKEIFEKRLKEIEKDQEKGRTIMDVFEKIETPLMRVLLEMEKNGVKLNVDLLGDMSEKIGKEIGALEEEIHDAAGRDFNINSPKQLAEILFDDLNIPTEGIKKTKTGYSTAASELAKMKDKHEIIGKIEKYREVFKLRSTYIDALPKLVDESSRLHTTFNQTVTATGRLSSENPNLQNIPIRTEAGKMIRTAFEAEEGKVFIAADYSQIELRVMAHISGDEKLIEAFNEGADIHKKTAAEVNKTSLDEVTKQMRSEAKALNFGVIYGMGSYGFSESAGISQKEAKEYIKSYMENFPGVAKYIEDTKDFVKKNEFVETRTGRRRYLPEINSSNFMVRSTAERMAINMPAQGFAADIMKLAMLAVYKEYKNNPDVKMILQIHDEIILEAKEELADEVSDKVRELMENIYKLNVPLVADVEVGKNWSEV
ncbi:DNA polymerase I [Patescibacteria group bacterium]